MQNNKKMASASGQQKKKQQPTKVWRVKAQPRTNNPRGARPEAPASQGFGSMPNPHFRSMAPTRKGAESRFVGCDYLGSLESSTSATVDSVYAISPIVGGTFPRLSVIGTVYGKYAFNKLKFTVVGTAGSQQSGAMTGCPVYESKNAGGTTLSVAQARNREGQRTTSLWQTNTVVYDCAKATLDWFPVLDTSNLQDISIWGEYHNVVDVTSTAISYGDLFVEYDIEFCEGQEAGDPVLIKEYSTKLCPKRLLDKKEATPVTLGKNYSEPLSPNVYATRPEEKFKR